MFCVRRGYVKNIPPSSGPHVMRNRARRPRNDHTWCQCDASVTVMAGRFRVDEGLLELFSVFFFSLSLCTEILATFIRSILLLVKLKFPNFSKCSHSTFPPSQSLKLPISYTSNFSNRSRSPKLNPLASAISSLLSPVLHFRNHLIYWSSVLINYYFIWQTMSYP